MNGIVPWTRRQAIQLPVLSPSIPVTSEPSASPSLRDWWREIQANSTPKPSSVVESAVVGLRHNAESGAIGALLGIIDTDLGGLDLAGRVPLDWVGAALFYFLSLQNSERSNGLASDFAAMGQSCTTIALFRQVHKWREGKKDIPQNTADLTGDPILRMRKTDF